MPLHLLLFTALWWLLLVGTTCSCLLISQNICCVDRLFGSCIVIIRTQWGWTASTVPEHTVLQVLTLHCCPSYMEWTCILPHAAGLHVWCGPMRICFAVGKLTVVALNEWSFCKLLQFQVTSISTTITNSVI